MYDEEMTAFEREKNTKELERILKALANKRRLGVLAHLKKTKQSSVGATAQAIKLSFKATSKHLGILSHADIVEKEQIGLTMLYSLSNPKPLLVQKLLDVL